MWLVRASLDANCCRQREIGAPEGKPCYLIAELGISPGEWCAMIPIPTMAAGAEASRQAARPSAGTAS